MTAVIRGLSGMPRTTDLRSTSPDTIAGVQPDCIDAAGLLSGAPVNPAVVQLISTAAASNGYLAIKNLFSHNNADLALLASMHEFFSLPDDDQRKAAVSVAKRQIKHGWMPLYGEPAYQPGTRAHVESFDFGRPRRGDDDPLHSSIWPELPGFHHASRNAWDVLSKAGFALLDAISVALDKPAPFLRAQCDSQDRSTMRLLHYPGQQRQAEPGDVGIAAHTDFECITLLYQTAAGLELRDPQGRWHDATASDRQVIVLFGDMLEAWSNGRFQATGHRVRMTDQKRMSFVLFFAVNDGVTVAPLDSCVDADNPPRYDALTQQQHSERELRRAEQYRDQS